MQVIQYAARAMQLARRAFGKDLEEEFLQRLEQAPSNIPENKNGRTVYEKFVKPAKVDWEKLVAHYAISSMFQSYTEHTRIFLYNFENQERHSAEAGKAKLAIGTVKITFDTTHESNVLSYAVLYLGEHNLTGAVRRFDTQEEFNSAVNELKGAFDAADFPQSIRLLDRHFGESSFTLRSLFKDEQRRILDLILSNTREDLESRYRHITERYTPLMKFLQDMGAPLPSALQTAADLVLAAEIKRELTIPQPDPERLRQLLDEAHARSVNVFDPGLAYAVKGSLERLLEKLEAAPDDLDTLKTAEAVARIVRPLPLVLNLWKVQNHYYEAKRNVAPWYQKKAAAGDETGRVWLEHFRGLGGELNFAVDDLNVSASACRRSFPRPLIGCNLRAGFASPDATTIVPYLHDLGISHCYASPLFSAVPGSTHGYDVCDFNQLNPHLGTREEFDEFVATLRRHGMGLILDMVPNHMGGDLSNPWWRDVLQWGTRSRYAQWFDIDWRPAGSDLADKVLLPVLEDHLGMVLEAGKLKVDFIDGKFSILYYDKAFPIAPTSVTA